MTYKELIVEMRRRLDPLFDHRERDAIILLLFHYLKEWGRVELIIHEGDVVSDFTLKEANAVVDRVLLGKPIQYIIGEARFHGMDFFVEPGVLIPRPETSELVDWILDSNPTRNLSILDIGTGTGCIAIALSRSLPFSKIMALDVSGEALRVARKNADRYKAGIDFIEANMYDWMPDGEVWDIVVSNPPYIAPDEEEDMEVRVKDHEPHLALFVDADDPIKPYRRIEEIARRGLKEGGEVFLELNPRFAADVAKLFDGRYWDSVELRRDSYGKVRMLRSVKA